LLFPIRLDPFHPFHFIVQEPHAFHSCSTNLKFNPTQFMVVYLLELLCVKTTIVVAMWQAW
jgi:hypothetical protein